MSLPLKPYPSYKDSGVAWLGPVPEHWEVRPGKACYREKKDANTGLKETTVLSLSYGQVVVKPEERLHGLVPASFETYQIIEPGDLVIRPTDLQNDQNSLRFGMSQHRGIITSAYMCFITTDVMDHQYGHLLLHSYDLKKVFYGLGSGLRQNLDWQDFKYLPCCVPPLLERVSKVAESG
jgi:type I restriction enzyme, S subunit